MSEDAPKPKPYKVGYGRPPVEHQFKRGQSGNKAGGKTRRDAMTLQQLLDRPITVREGGEVKQMSPKEVTVRTHAKKALEGERKSTFYLAELFLKHDAYPAAAKRQVQSVVNVPTSTMPYEMAKFIVLQYGSKAQYSAAELRAARQHYLATRNDEQAEIDALIGYPALQEGDSE